MELQSSSDRPSYCRSIEIFEKALARLDEVASHPDLFDDLHLIDSLIKRFELTQQTLVSAVIKIHNYQATTGIEGQRSALEMASN